MRAEVEALRAEIAELRGQTVEMAGLLHKAAEWKNAENDISRQMAEITLREALEAAGL